MMNLQTENLNNFVVVDTSAILYDADCIFSFPNHDVVIPLIVLDEIDKFRSQDDDTGRNARKFIRTIDSLRKRGDLSSGVPLGDTTSSMLKVYIPTIPVTNIHTNILDLGKNDDKILSVCMEIQYDGVHLTDGKKANVLLVTKDISLLVKANVLGIESQFYSADRPVQDSSELYSGCMDIFVPKAVIDSIYAIDYVELDVVLSHINQDFFGGPKYTKDMFFPNACVTMVDEANRSALCVVKKQHNDVVFRKVGNKFKVSSVEPKNKEQRFAMDLIMDEAVKLVTLTGKAGTGKTLLAIACGIHLTMDIKRYDRLVVSRPVFPLGKDIGFLPGDTNEKMDPWIGPIKDAVEFVFGGDRSKYEEMKSFGYIEIEPLTYIRGRSMPRTLFILDESQNLTRHEMKTIVSRIGKDSKIILTGDVFQIDNPYLDTTTNGLTCVVERFKNYDLAGHVTFVTGQRSDLASLASEIL